MSGLAEEKRQSAVARMEKLPPSQAAGPLRLWNTIIHFLASHDLQSAGTL